MLGSFQKSHLRIEVEASEKILLESLLNTKKLSQWFWISSLESGLPEKLRSGLTFSSWIGLVEIGNQVEIANDNCLRLLLSKGIDGYQEWYWGEGWVQSRLEGISLLPLNLGQTLSLLSLRQFVSKHQEEAKKEVD